MSICIECEKDMDWAEARQNLICRECRRLKKISMPVRDLSRRGTEHVGRSCRSSRVLGGDPDSHGNERRCF